MKKLKILIGACGGLTGVYLSKYFKGKYEQVYEIYGFDSSSEIATKYFVDKLFISPSLTKEEEFISFLIELINKENIQLYLPTYSREVQLISKWEEMIKSKTKVSFLVSPYKTTQVLEDKKSAYRKLREIGINTPKTYEKTDEMEYPIFCKPTIGSGSKETLIIYNKSEYEFYESKYKNAFFSEYLKGKEYTVDTIFDKDGKLIAYNQRIRIKTLGGAVITTKNNFEIDAKKYIEQIASHYLIRGVANFQFFLCDEMPIFTDINLRFASGGLPLSVESGVDIPTILVKLLMDEEIYLEQYQSDRKVRTMYRYFQEIYEVE